MIKNERAHAVINQNKKNVLTEMAHPLVRELSSLSTTIHFTTWDAELIYKISTNLIIKIVGEGSKIFF